MLYTYKEIYKYKINEQEYLTYSVSTFPKDNLPHFPKGKKKKVISYTTLVQISFKKFIFA